jgi:hypothetical protein
MNPEIQKLQEQIDELNKKFSSLSNNTTIPIDIGNAMGVRLGALKGDVSGVAASTYNNSKFINEAGSSSYTINFAKPIAGLISVQVNGTPRLVPYY